MIKNSDRFANLLYGKVVGERTVVAEVVPDALDLERSRGYHWDKKLARYVSNWNGQIVSEATVRRSIENYNKLLDKNLQNLADKLAKGTIDLPTWQEKVALELKNAHVINASIGKGGRAQMTWSDWGKTGSRLKFQYQRLNLFAQQIKLQMVSPAQIKARLSMYANSVRTSYFDGLTRANIAAGYTHEQRVTTSEKPCDSCTTWANAGWQAIGTVPEPGVDCDGYTNCKCYKRYKKERVRI